MARCYYCWDRAKSRCQHCGYLQNSPPDEKWFNHHKWLETIFKKLKQFGQRTTYNPAVDLQVATKFGSWRSDLLLRYDSCGNVTHIYGPNDEFELVEQKSKKARQTEGCNLL